MVESLFKIIEIFKTNKINYCLIGGLAMLLHNGRANTVDIDLYILVDTLKRVIKILETQGLIVKQAGDYQLKTSINGVPIDLLLADHYVGIDVVHRAIEKPLGTHFVRIATPEDIIVLKTIANRSIDRRDIEELRELYKGLLDEEYISKKLAAINKMLDS